MHDSAQAKASKQAKKPHRSSSFSERFVQPPGKAQRARESKVGFLARCKGLGGGVLEELVLMEGWLLLMLVALQVGGI